MIQDGLSEYGEIPRLEFTGFLDWFVTFTHPYVQWNRRPTYIISEYVYIIIGLLTFIHSQRLGGCYKCLWVTTLFHGLVVEGLSQLILELDIYWHSAATVMLLGRRLPLHVILRYPAFIYTASVAVSRMRLSKWAEPFTVSLAVLLMDTPYEMLGVRFLHWSWHDTDPNIWDRFYWVPWNSLCLQATTAASFTFFFHFYRKTVTGMERHISASLIRELLCSLLTSLSAMPGGVLLLVAIYHPLHDVLGIHTETCFFITIASFCLLAWTADRNPVVGSRPRKADSSCSFNEIPLSLLLHYGVYLGVAVYGKPEEEIAVGLHQPTGPCGETIPMRTVFGVPLSRKKYLCTQDFDEGYFNFQCLPSSNPPPNGVEWYTVCGVPLLDRTEYITVVATLSWVALVVFYNMLFCSGREIGTKSWKSKSH